MTDEHATALNSVLSVGGLRAELAAIVRYAGQCAEQDEQVRRAVYEKYHIEGMKAVERAGKSWRDVFCRLAARTEAAPMTYTMRRPTPDERDKITRCRRQFFEVERLGLLKEQVETLLPARLNDGMPRGSPTPYGIDDKMIRAERTRREYDEAVKLLEVYREEARKAIDALHPSPPQRGFLLSFYVDGYTMKECYIGLHIDRRSAYRYTAFIERSF